MLLMLLMLSALRDRRLAVVLLSIYTDVEEGEGRAQRGACAIGNGLPLNQSMREWADLGLDWLAEDNCARLVVVAGVAVGVV
jgi:hypothetical protein